MKSSWLALALASCLAPLAACDPPGAPAGGPGADDLDPASAGDVATPPEATATIPKSVVAPAGAAPAVAASATPPPITYHGGPVMLGPTRTYLIWYGNWANNTATTILPDLLGKLGGSPYFNINATYGDAAGHKVPSAIAYGGATTDAYSHGAALTDAGVWAVVTGAIAAKKVPSDPNGIYVVLSSADVNETSGLCTAYCGWHTMGFTSAGKVRFAYVGNPARCLSACAPQSPSPNGNAGADGMASILVHELSETVTDPDLNAWYDANGAENADKCAWTFGATYKAPNGTLANVKLGTRNYLLQQDWLATGGCTLTH